MSLVLLEIQRKVNQNLSPSEAYYVYGETKLTLKQLKKRLLTDKI